MPQSLDLPGYTLLETHQEDDDLHMRLEWTGTLACTHCGAVGEVIRYGRETERRFLDTPARGRRVASGCGRGGTSAGRAPAPSRRSCRAWTAGGP